MYARDIIDGKLYDERLGAAPSQQSFAQKTHLQSYAPQKIRRENCGIDTKISFLSRDWDFGTTFLQIQLSSFKHTVAG